MRSFASERYAPITSSIGFLELPLERVVDGFVTWDRSLGRRTETEPVPFPDGLERLPPLVGGSRPRRLFAANGSGWTAYFDCGLRGTDAVSVVGHLSRTLGCQGVAIRATPHTVGVADGVPARFGAVQFELFGPLPTEFMNYVRTVHVTFNGRAWEFAATGTEQPFEEVDAYRARRVRDRFTSEMLERYCRALGVDPFEPDAYGSPAYLVTNDERTEGLQAMSLAEAQQWLGIVPGQVDELPG